MTSHRSGLARRVAPPVCGSFLCGSFHPPKLAQPGPSQLVSFNTARPARPSAARIIHQSSTSSALRSSSHQRLFALSGPSQLVSFTTAHLHSSALCSSSHSLQLAQVGPSQLVSFTTARLARPFTTRLIHHSSPSPAPRSSCYLPQLAQLGPSQLVSSTLAGPARPFAARLIHHSSASRASPVHPPRSFQPVLFTDAASGPRPPPPRADPFVRNSRGTERNDVTSARRAGPGAGPLFIYLFIYFTS